MKNIWVLYRKELKSYYSSWIAYLLMAFFAVIFGLTSRGEGTLINIILAQYYGRNSFGAISGFVNPFNMLGLGFGPLAASIAFDLTGSYRAVLNVFAAISLLSALLLWIARRPELSHKKEVIL